MKCNFDYNILSLVLGPLFEKVHTLRKSPFLVLFVFVFCEAHNKSNSSATVAILIVLK